jgi:uncharacterized protein with PQ loop repeat
MRDVSNIICKTMCVYILKQTMQTDLPRIVAILAPTVNTVQALPQLLKTLETKTVVGLSFYMVALMMLTNFLWFFHGFYIQDTQGLLRSSLMCH